MTVSVTTLEMLVKAGLSGPELLAVVRQIEADNATPERSKSAVRQARYRERLKAKEQGDDVTRDVTRDATDDVTNVTADPLNVPPDENNSNPPLIPRVCDESAPARLDFGAIAVCVRLAAEAHIAAEKAAKKARYHRLPADWEPPAELPEKLAAKVAQWPPGMIDDEADAFRAWAANAKDENGKGRKLHWDQAFHNWLRSKHDEWQRRAQPRLIGVNGGRQGKPRTLADRFAERATRVG